MPANEQPEGTVDEIEGSRSSNPTNKITRQEAREHFEIFSKKRKGQTGERGQREDGRQTLERTVVQEKSYGDRNQQVKF